MPDQNEITDFHGGSKWSSSATWITVIAAAGITATAFFVAKRLRAAAAKANTESWFDVCDRAAQTLDDRLTQDFVYAAR